MSEEIALKTARDYAKLCGWELTEPGWRRVHEADLTKAFLAFAGDITRELAHAESERDQSEQAEHVLLEGNNVLKSQLSQALRELGEARLREDKITLSRDSWILISDQYLADRDAARRSTAELRGALEPFANYASGFGPHARDDDWVLSKSPSGKRTITMGHVRAAFTALASSSTKET